MISDYFDFHFFDFFRRSFFHKMTQNRWERKTRVRWTLVWLQVAGSGFEPLTSRLWAWRAATALPRIADNKFTTSNALRQIHAADSISRSKRKITWPEWENQSAAYSLISLLIQGGRISMKMVFVLYTSPLIHYSNLSEWFNTQYHTQPPYFVSWRSGIYEYQ